MSFKQPGFLYRVFTELCHLGYRVGMSCYDHYKKLKTHAADQFNPYNYISLYNSALKIGVIDKNYTPSNKFPKYTTITPVLNEENNIARVLAAIEEQSYPSDQVIIIDGGSTDNTLDEIKKYTQHSSLNITTLTSDFANIAYQRNLGIKYSRNEIILNVDAGTYLSENYATNIIGPFLEYKDLDLSIGMHYPKIIYPWSIHFSSAERFKRRMEPCGACIAYRKSIALQIGLYPEYTTYAGEDTFFCYKYKKLSKHWIFNKSAFIFWEHPDSFRKAQDKVMSYMRANFEIGLWPYFYNGTRFQLPLWIGYIFKTFRENFPTFLKMQTNVELDKRHIKSLQFIFSKNRITEDKKLRDLAVKLISENNKVFFVDFADQPPKDPTSMFIDTDHSLLELVHHTNFNIVDFQKRYGNFMTHAVFNVEYASDEVKKQLKNLL